MANIAQVKQILGTDDATIDLIFSEASLRGIERETGAKPNKIVESLVAHYKRLAVPVVGYSAAPRGLIGTTLGNADETLKTNVVRHAIAALKRGALV